MDAAAGWGEFDRIARQIDQYLLQSQAVAKQSTWQLRVQIEHDFDIFLPQVATQHHCQIAQQWWMYRGEDKKVKGAA